MIKKEDMQEAYMLENPMTIEELLEAKEGEQYQFKEAKRHFDFNEAARCCCALANCGGGNPNTFLSSPPMFILLS